MTDIIAMRCALSLLKVFLRMSLRQLLILEDFVNIYEKLLSSELNTNMMVFYYFIQMKKEKIVLCPGS